MDLDKKNDECNNLYSKNDKKLNPFEKVSCTTKQSYLFLISPFYLKKSNLFYSVNTKLLVILHQKLT